MVAFTTSLLATLLSAAAVSASKFQVNTYSDSGCSGSEDTLYIDTSSSYCFQNVHGNSLAGFAGDDVYDCVATTWSGTNCEGSSADWTLNPDNGCNEVPYASVSFGCYEVTGFKA